MLAQPTNLRCVLVDCGRRYIRLCNPGLDIVMYSCNDASSQCRKPVWYLWCMLILQNPDTSCEVSSVHTFTWKLYYMVICACMHVSMWIYLSLICLFANIIYPFLCMCAFIDFLSEGTLVCVCVLCVYVVCVRARMCAHMFIVLHGMNLL